MLRRNERERTEDACSSHKVDILSPFPFTKSTYLWFQQVKLARFRDSCWHIPVDQINTVSKRMLRCFC